ncbi:hypothetical protein DFO70_11120 [Cytobacillus firmus]|uniref:Uncharacterized protein n=2 Tax=Cytobacillus TaxID=2675230 RepID=A0A366JQ36_CYTFI|nr:MULTISPECIES: hypothetical protein [Cytobacillus]RBP89373.1 hypothetical protein DFO70_11120 [Cytobacillus firmus]TDX47400.1 hypothetical protein DFO72_101497 [Cytobacillus oceanisediminis]
MDKLSEIKADIKRGRLPLRSINWLVTELESQREINKEIKQKSRYKNYMEMAKENLALEEALKRTQSQRDYYKNQLNKLRV